MRINEITRPNSLFQQWQALLLNRTKRTQTGLFIIQGVRPINAALEQKLELEYVLYREGNMSHWAKHVLSQTNRIKSYRLSAKLMQDLGEKDEDAPEVIFVAKIPKLNLANIPSTDLRSQFVLVLDRPQNPGNIGALIRSADALGAAMIVITGHAADPYDPKAVRASRGSLFAIPVVSTDSPSGVVAWIKNQPNEFTIMGLSEDADTQIWDTDLQQPTVAVIGNETWGLSKQWKETCNSFVSIPMRGTASSLNAASSGAILLYEYARQVAQQ